MYTFASVARQFGFTLEISIMRSLALALFLLASTAALASSAANPAAPPPPAMRGVVADATGGIVPGAEVDLIDSTGAVTGSFHSDGEGKFQVIAPHDGAFTLVVSEPGFETVRTPVVIVSHSGAKAASPLAPLLRIVLPIASFSTTVRVSAENNEDLTATEENRDSSVMDTDELKELPIFDNDYATAMSAFLDDSATATGGTGLLVDGVEANHATVSSSAVQEVRINQDPYSAQYYWPGRGQMEILTKSAADHYHGEFNFLFRNSAMNAQNALAPSKPFEQRQSYEGNITGPIPHMAKSSFLGSFNRVLYDQDAVVSATVSDPSHPGQPVGFQANVSAPQRDTEFSTRAAHQFGDKHSGYVQYSYQDWTGQNQGVGGQALAAAGYDNEYREDDTVIHLDSTLSAVLLNQISVVAVHDSSRNENAQEAPRISVSGDFVSGSAQGDSFGTEYNFHFYDMATWTRGRHTVKAGVDTPHIARRAYDDRTNALGTYTFGPTLAADGVTVLETALENYNDNLPSGFSENTGDTHFIYHQQEVGAFVQDQYKISDRFSITPGIRYDWQNFLGTRRLGFAPRASFAWVLNENSKLVVRGGGGIYYDRFGSGPLLDLVLYENARRRSITLSLDPADPNSSCYPITACQPLADQPPNLAQLAPNAKLPYQIQYGLSIERQLGEKATGTVSGYSARGIDEFRSVDVNAPTAASGYTERPNPDYGRIRQMQPAAFFEGDGMDVSYRGRWNRYFTGFGRYTWSHYETNTGGIGWFPQNQSEPNDEWSNAGWDRRHRLGMYAMFHPESVLNLSAGIFANTGTPWTIVTGTDAYGDGLFNTRPDGVERNTETNPSYVDLDLRWGHDFHLTPSKDEEAPKLGFSAGAFNVLNHLNGSGIDTVETSSSFGQITAAAPPRRIQLGMRFEF
jgi:hypothetical protein